MRDYVLNLNPSEHWSITQFFIEVHNIQIIITLCKVHVYVLQFGAYYGPCVFDVNYIN